MLLQDSLPSAEAVREAVERVYARPEFAPPPPENAWQAFWGWFWEQVGRFFQWIAGLLDGLRGLESTAPVLFWAVVGWLAVSALAIIAHLVWTAAQAGRGERGPEGAGAPRRRGPRTAADWEAEARRAAAEGRLRDAAMALYQALILRLDARGAVRFDPAKTPGDYRREAARNSPEAADALRAFLRVFEPVAFGGRPIDADGYGRLEGAARQGGAGA